MHYSVIAYVLVIDFLAIMSPGPDFFMVLKNSMTSSLKSGIYTTLGISLGSSIIFAICIFGLGILVAHSEILFKIIKFAGAGYLTYLALKSIIAKPHIEEPQLVYADKPVVNNSEYFRIGLICNLTNPKAFMFIVSLSTYVAEHGNPIQDGIVIILGSTLATLLWFSLVACVFGTVMVRRIFYKQQRLINVSFGLVLLYVAFKIVQL